MATTIAISEDLKEKLRDLGRAGDSYDDIIRKMYEITSRHLLLAYLYDESDTATLDEFRAEIEKKWPK